MNKLELQNIENAFFKISYRIPSKLIFGFLAILQAACFYAVDQNIIPTFIYELHTDKIIITYSLMVMLCYNGKKKLRLFLSSAVSCLILFTPIASYNLLNIDEIGHAHNDTTYILLMFLYPILFSLNYYYHNYGIKLTNTGNQAYMAFWLPIINIITACFYLIITTTTVFLFIFMTKLAGLTMLWDEFTNITLIKAYLPIIFSTFLWIIYKHPNTSENIIRGSSYLAHHLYWLVAPLGLVFLLSGIISIITHFSLPDINYRPLFAICIISIALFQLANSPNENETKSNKIIEKIVVYYNNLLPLIPVTYLYKIFTNFSEQNGDLMCNAAVLETGINWGNFTPLLAAISLLYLTVVQAYYTNQDRSVMQQDLAKTSWWWCAIFTIICLIAYNPYFSIEEDNNHYNLNCHHFKKHTLTTLQSRNLA